MPPTVARSYYDFAMEPQDIMDCLDTCKRPSAQAEWADRCGTGPAEDLGQQLDVEGLPRASHVASHISSCAWTATSARSFSLFSSLRREEGWS